MSAVKRLVVAGGNGFLGSRVCKFAVARGWDASSHTSYDHISVSIQLTLTTSRSGEPRWDAVTASAAPPPWAHKVTWERADILRPTTYTALLKDADYVVHSLGILLEADYKGIVRGTESPLAAIRKSFSASVDRGVDPFARKEGEDIKPPNPKDQMSYEIMNRDSAIALARHAESNNVGTFCYVSALAGPPGVPARYISTKREAERAIAEHFPKMRNVFVRPPFMYDASRGVTMGIAAATGVGTLFNGLTKGVFGNLMGAGGVKPLKVDTVAEGLVEALDDANVHGPIETEQIEELATRAWRRGML
ncbi:hypothetical protein jhhlp_001249 [Lomentospora prolificans]|uniref:NAD-dependent epimerase/dehydratase domain-containing protein n=1 Tax=Lomentospora prolificans TaxID=41688 RepID=A0A2N3NHP6_9PEZI|nr:hypothetical protein jhhlp_001249 [Lomentospora prolificans]